MRLIGHLESETLAQQVSRLMVHRGIPHLVEPEDERRWAVWVQSEEDLGRARELLRGFLANPSGPEYRVAMAEGGGDSRSGGGAGAGKGGGRRVPVGAKVAVVTVVTLVVCVGVAVLTGLGMGMKWVRPLQISEVFFRWGRSWELFLPEVRSGEVWRLVTPAVLHFGLPHLLFNLWAFWDLGRMIEIRRGSGRLMGLMVGLGVISNLGQYLVSGPRFGGLSGVVYGLFGYAWMMGRYRSDLGVGVHPHTVVMMLVWFVICLSGALPVEVANTAHGVGLVMGVIWGRLGGRWR